MTILMRLLYKGEEPLEQPCFLRSFDPDAHNGGGAVVFTKDIPRAKRFANWREMMEFWRLQSTVNPLRHDGKPNRPLTTFTIQSEVIP